MPDDRRLPDWPAAMREDRAAAYLDVGATYFRTRIAPELAALRPSKGVVLYRRKDLDAWLDRPSQATEINPFLGTRLDAGEAAPASTAADRPHVAASNGTGRTCTALTWAHALR